MFKRQINVSLAKPAKDDGSDQMTRNYEDVVIPVIAGVNNVVVNLVKIAIVYKAADAAMFIIVNKALGRTSE